MDEISKYLNQIIKDANVSVNLLACSGGKGSEEYKLTDADSAGARLQRKLTVYNERNIPVITRRHVVWAGTNKSTVNLDLSHDDYNKLSEQEQMNTTVHKQPGSKLKFETDFETGEQFKKDVYFENWKSNLIEKLKSISQKSNDKTIQDEVTRWQVEIEKSDVANIIEFIKKEYDNPRSVLNKDKDDIMQQGLYYQILPKLVEGQRILRSKYTFAKPVKIAVARRGFHLNKENVQSANAIKPVIFYLPSTLNNWTNVSQLHNKRLINYIIEQKPELIKSIDDFSQAVSYVKNKEAFTRNFIKNFDPEEFLKYLLKPYKSLTGFDKDLVNNLFEKFTCQDFADICKTDLQAMYVINNIPEEMRLPTLELLSSKMKFSLYTLTEIYNKLDENSQNVALTKNLLNLDFNIHHSYEKILNGQRNKPELYAILKYYRDQRELNTDKYYHFGASLFGGVDRATKLQTADSIMSAFREAIKNNQKTLTIDTGDLDFDKFNEAVKDNSTLGIIFSEIAKQFDKVEITSQFTNKMNFR